MSWQDRFMPASYAGVPFKIDGHNWKSGRRIVEDEFPLRDEPYTEDMGRKIRRYTIQGYVIADLTTGDYFNERDQLAFACETKGIFQLVHPYFGRLKVRCVDVDVHEDGEHGGQAIFNMVFVEGGLPPSPTAMQDTSASLLSGLNSMLKLTVKVYAVARLIADRPGILLGLAEGIAGSFASSLLGISPSVLASVAGLVTSVVSSLGSGAATTTSSITGAVGDPVAIAVTDVFAAVSTNVAALAILPVSDTVTGQVQTATIMPADPTYGVAALASFGATLPPPMGLQVPLQTELQAQLVDLVRTAAVMAVATIYAGTQWTTGAAAALARQSLLIMIQERLGAAAASAQDDLFQAWLGIGGLATADLLQRAQNLPNLTAYATPRSLPAPVLAQLLYQDGTRAAELAALNTVIHPGFMPIAGAALAA